MLWIFLLGVAAGVFVGVWIHGMELWNKARTHDLIKMEWKKRG